jgi:hypothetical protein
MTTTANGVDMLDSGDGDGDNPAPTAAELEQWRRDAVLATGDKIAPDRFPRMYNLSAGHIYKAVIRPEQPQRPEYVTIPLQHGMCDLETAGAISRWNMLWEAGQFRRRFFDEAEFPAPLAKIADQGDVNISLIPRTNSRYYEYAPLYHLLPRATLERFGLPLLHAGQWPFMAAVGDVDAYLPADFHERLARAWGHAVWRHLMPGSPPSAFTRDDPIRMLAHSLDFWLPAVAEVIHETLDEFPLVSNGVTPGPVPLIDGSHLPGAIMVGPRRGGDIWSGEDDAAEALEGTVEHADRTGQLRAILDAVRTHRVEEDFSARWSYAREDFERKLYRKRAKVQVRFVELTDTIPVQGPESEVVGNLVTSDFLALLDPVDRQVVVLLRSGLTKLTDVAQELGYANHSAVSKRLARIRQQAQEYFDELD